MKEFLETYKGNIFEVTFGKQGKTVILGGENTLAFHSFEGSLPHPPLIALEVWDVPPQTWSEHLHACFGDVVFSPTAWAKKCLEVYRADLICLYLASAGREEVGVEALASGVKELSDALPVPLVVYGVGEKDADSKALKEIARACAGDNLLLGPVVKDNYEEVGRVALECGHRLIVQSPLDINLAKELNIRLLKFFPKERIIIDPLSSALGYGMEYSFSVMERIKQVAVIYTDNMMNMPLIANVGRDCWKTKEAKANTQQGILWEAITALTLFLAGANLAVMSSPDSMKLVRKMITQLS
jgi:acetyl-CoA decarbonylase/synthase complex subunit delta